MNNTARTHSDARMTALFDKTGTFFAFSNEQFEKAQIAGVKYADGGMGMCVPVHNTKELMQGLALISKERIEQDLKLNTREQIIRESLSNYECFYSGDIDPCIERLAPYGITEKEIKDHYDHVRATEDIEE